MGKIIHVKLCTVCAGSHRIDGELRSFKCGDSIVKLSFNCKKADGYSLFFTNTSPRINYRCHPDWEKAYDSGNMDNICYPEEIEEDTENRILINKYQPTIDDFYI